MAGLSGPHEGSKYHFPGFPGGKQPKNPRNTFISKINRSYSNGLANKAKEIPCGLSKAHGKIQV